jgi:predicted nucleotide-binding protein (sugar kinase/HSP70/actin superfamily)
MLEGGAPCVIDAYMGYLERFIVEQHLDDLFLLVPGANNDHCGYDPLTLAKYTLPALLVADIMIEIEQVIYVVGDSHARTQMKQEWGRFIAAATTLEQFHAQLPGFVDRLASLPRQRNPLDCPRVLVTGDFFTRFSPFFMEGVREIYSEHGIILKPVELNGLLLYGAYNMVSEAAGGWGLKPGGAALAKACTRIFQPDGKEYLRRWLAYQTEKRAEAYYRKIFQKSGYLLSPQGDPAATFTDASEHISPRIYGEVIPTVGDGVRAQVEGYDGIIIIGPFNCLPFRIAEAILKPLSIRRGMPILTYESDGYAVSPSFLRQVEVHTQQVLEHRARKPIQDAA